MKVVSTYGSVVRSEGSDARLDSAARTAPLPRAANATVTPRAVIKAVHKTLKYVAENRDKLYADSAK
jgi:Na+-translocating ferredoxin:NAD+ oxidoreductase RnfG subunit